MRGTYLRLSRVVKLGARVTVNPLKMCFAHILKKELALEIY